MRILYIYCHPLAESFHAAIREQATAALRGAGHDIDMLDLYAEGFEPVLSAEERRRYHDLARNREGLEHYISRLHAADGLVVQFPTWSYGPPAVLKGFVDRLILPGVAFDLSDPARVRPLLTRIRRLLGISTYGQSRYAAWAMGDPPRRFVTRYLRWFVAPDARVRYMALYGMNTAAAARRTAFLDQVQSTMGRP